MLIRARKITDQLCSPNPSLTRLSRLRSKFDPHNKADLLPQRVPSWDMLSNMRKDIFSILCFREACFTRTAAAVVRRGPPMLSKKSSSLSGRLWITHYSYLTILIFPQNPTPQWSDTVNFSWHLSPFLFWAHKMTNLGVVCRLCPLRGVVVFRSFLISRFKWGAPLWRKKIPDYNSESKRIPQFFEASLNISTFPHFSDKTCISSPRTPGDSLLSLSWFLFSMAAMRNRLSFRTRSLDFKLEFFLGCCSTPAPNGEAWAVLLEF